MGERVMHNGDPIPVGETSSSVPDVQVGQVWRRFEGKDLDYSVWKVIGIGQDYGFAKAAMRREGGDEWTFSNVVNMTSECGWSLCDTEPPPQTKKVCYVAPGQIWVRDGKSFVVANVRKSGFVYFTDNTSTHYEAMTEANGWFLDEDVPDDCDKAEEIDELEAMRCVDDYLSRLPIEAQRRALIWLDAKWHERKKEREFDDCSLGATE